MASVGASAAKLIVQFYINHMHGFNWVVCPVENSEMGKYADLNLAPCRIVHNRFSLGKRSTFQLLQPSHQGASIGNAYGKKKMHSI